MPATIVEKWESRETTMGDGAAVDLKFLVRGTDDDIVANNFVLTDTPATYTLANGAVLVRNSSTGERVAEDAWEITVRYTPIEYPETGSSSYNFDTGGGTHHITQALATVATYAPPGETAPNFHGAIGVTNDGVEGVDITVPVYNFTETHYIPVALVTPAYKLTLFALTGTVNNTLFRGFAPGELLF